MYEMALLSYRSFFTPSVYSTELKSWYHAVGTMWSIQAKFCAICSLSCEMKFLRPVVCPLLVESISPDGFLIGCRNAGFSGISCLTENLYILKICPTF